MNWFLEKISSISQSMNNKSMQLLESKKQLTMLFLKLLSEKLVNRGKPL